MRKSREGPSYAFRLKKSRQWEERERKGKKKMEKGEGR